MKFDFELNQKCTTANGFVTYLNINIKYVNGSGIVPDLLKKDQDMTNKVEAQLNCDQVPMIR
jgi:hypothetical protein